MIVREIRDRNEMLEQYPLLVQLNARLTKENYERMLDEMLRGGYRMAGIFEDEKCIGLSGFWIGTKIYSGKYLEPDNVVIDVQHRSKGAGKILCDWLIETARKENCETVMLDAYLENEAAHLFYEREGFVKRGYHFIRKV